jgi:hypothetical protein
VEKGMNGYRAPGSYTVETAIITLQAGAGVLHHVLSSVRMLKRSGAGGKRPIALMQAQHSHDESHLRDDRAPIAMHFSSSSIYKLD